MKKKNIFNFDPFYTFLPSRNLTVPSMIELMSTMVAHLRLLSFFLYMRLLVAYHPINKWQIAYGVDFVCFNPNNS